MFEAMTMFGFPFILYSSNPPFEIATQPVSGTILMLAFVGVCIVVAIAERVKNSD
jgi:hypothetical protein